MTGIPNDWCQTCSGEGYVIDEYTGSRLKCKDCDGSGETAASLERSLRESMDSQ